MAFIRERQLSANGLDFFIAEAGETGQPLVLCLHGFPECWASWRYQLPVLAQSGYHAVAPDLRGYGFTGGPVEVEAYRQSQLAADVAALIEAMGHEQAIVIGHDWGSALTWQVARCYPDKVRALVSLSVPYGGPAPVPPTQAMRKLFGDGFFYMLYFQQPDRPEQELEKDVDDSLRRMFHALSADGIGDFRVKPDDTGILQAMPRPEVQPRWMREEDLAYYVERFRHSGFTGPVNWYRAMDMSWEESHQDDNWQIPMPALFLGGMQDPVVMFSQKALERMPDYVPDLRTVMLDHCGHWIQMEQAAEVNREILAFLEEVDG
ncbi:alpha/beta hydrolase [Alcanivorax hongdengensis A-11-3]|uniref:Alpha/beta hydrolase n=1 Tax=Alcanivorax hongdengensis A-11-3 TaxID=1177179 RepID=L0WBY5_9GAMM|nr:alpha/beta hydrolase [Alcanivorax hongdengensis]EKF74451.1 alpha/beta hydrolase [Alcanivorax hongdengensis A-11-3]